MLFAKGMKVINHRESIPQSQIWREVEASINAPNTKQCRSIIKFRQPLPSQVTLIVIVATCQTLAESNILVADSAVASLLQLLLRRPDLSALTLLAGTVLHDNFAAALLEEEWALLHVWVQLAVDEETGIEIFLCALAEDLVLLHDACVQIRNGSECLFGGVLVTPDFVVHDGHTWCLGHEFLHHHEC
jgi:hypothetical protein